METVVKGQDKIAVLTASNGLLANSAVHTSPTGGSLGSSDNSCGLSPSSASPSTSQAGTAAVSTDPSASRKRPHPGQKEPDPDAIKMFVGQVPRSYDEATLRKMFEEYGDVYQLNVLRDKATLQSRGCCFVTFFSRADAISAQATLHNIKVLPGMHHPIQMKPADAENRNERKLFVGMLSKKYNEAEVRAMFAQYGHIEDCSVLRDPNANSKGCAFVTFNSRPCAAAAIKAMHHSTTMEGCSQPIVVKFADTQKEKEQKKAQALAPPPSSLPSLASAQPSLPPPPQAANPLATQLALLGQTGTMGLPNGLVGTTNPLQQQLMSLLMAQQGQAPAPAALPPQPAPAPPNPLAGLFGLPGSQPLPSPTANPLQAGHPLQVNGGLQAGAGLQAGLQGPGLQQLLLQQQLAAQYPTASLAAYPASSGAYPPSSAAAPVVSLSQGGTSGQPGGDNALLQQLLSGLVRNGQMSQSAQAPMPSSLPPLSQSHMSNMSQSQMPLGGMSQMSQSQEPSMEAQLAQQQALLLEQQQMNEPNYAGSTQETQGLEVDGLMPTPVMNGSSLIGNTWQPFGLPPNHHLLHTPIPQPTILSSGASTEQISTLSSAGKGLSYGLGSLGAFTGIPGLAQSGFPSALPGLMSSQPGNGKQMEGPDGANLFIYHLPQEFTDQDLAQTFCPFGNVVSAKVFIDKQTNLSKCFGFVSYDSPVAAAAAISAMNGFAIGTKRLKVQLKRSKGEGKPYAHPPSSLGPTLLTPQ